MAAIPTAAWDPTAEIPDEILTFILESLAAADRTRCSLVCRRWNAVDGETRRSLSLKADAELEKLAPCLFNRFVAVSQLGLYCHRGLGIVDSALALISLSVPNLAGIDLYECRALTHVGVSALARNCPKLGSFSTRNCKFGPRGVDSVLRGCPLLHRLSIDCTLFIGSGSPSVRSLRFVGVSANHSFTHLMAGFPNLTAFEVVHTHSGNADILFEDMVSSARMPAGIVEIYLEGLTFSDHTLLTLSYCRNLEVLSMTSVNSCTDAGLSAIANSCRRLRKAYINGMNPCTIGGKGVALLLRCCNDLRELELTMMKADPVRSLTEGSCSATLERLDVYIVDFGDAEISCVAAECKSLKMLRVTMCGVTDRGIQALANGCPNLVKLEVNRCRGVTREGMYWLGAKRPLLELQYQSWIGGTGSAEHNTSLPRPVPEETSGCIRTQAQITQRIIESGEGSSSSVATIDSTMDAVLGAPTHGRDLCTSSNITPTGYYGREVIRQSRHTQIQQQIQQQVVEQIQQAYQQMQQQLQEQLQAQQEAHQTQVQAQHEAHQAQVQAQQEQVAAQVQQAQQQMQQQLQAHQTQVQAQQEVHQAQVQAQQEQIAAQVQRQWQTFMQSFASGSTFPFSGFSSPPPSPSQ